MPVTASDPPRRHQSRRDGAGLRLSASSATPRESGAAAGGYNSNQAANGRDGFGDGNKFITPMIINGKVYVGTTTGVGVFGLLSPAAK